MFTLTWPCKWQGCINQLNEKDHHKATRYCIEHKAAARKLRIQKMNRKRYLVRKIKKSLKKCTVCNSDLGKNQTKFCSKECSNTHFKIKREQKKIRRSIEFHTKKIVVLLERLK